MRASNQRPLLIDVTRLIWRCWKGRRPTGIDRVCLAYLDHYASRAQAVVQMTGFRRILSASASDALFAALRSPAKAFRSNLIRTALRHGLSALVPQKGRGRLYLNVGHTGLDRAGFAGWTKAVDCRPVFMVHDLIPITHPHFCRAGEDVKHRRRIDSVLQSARGVIGNSQDTLDALDAYARATGQTVPPQIVAHLGTHVPRPLAAVTPPDRPTFVALGTIEGRKNHALLLDVWARLISTHGNTAPRLIIIGQRGWNAHNVFDRLDHDPHLKGHVIERPHCSDEELATLLAGARALLFPSHVEGFGMPLMEAYAVSIPVIASDIGVFREIAGDAPDYAAPDDAKRWADLVMAYAAPQSPQRTAQVERIKQVRLPDWPAHFAAVDDWLAEL